ncbi:ATP-binding protein [Pseudooceanicola onchidii]|uniref:ATP-binding protein n=1 Tax=Pseudooceanicola onchidii TaxID=2562279 RepID=UPI0010AA289F|nr:ATP-binding protein [Pseudooceanicola onchidii]
MDHRKEIDRLYALEYGDKFEFACRMLLVATGAVIHFNYTGTIVALVWCLCFLVAHAAFFITLRTRPQDCTAHDTRQAGAMGLVMLSSFIWLPAWLIAQEDVALRISGTAATGALLVFLIHRSDRMKWMVIGEIVMVALAVSYVVLTNLHDVASAGAQMVMGFAGFALIAYFSRTILDHRKQRIEAEAASIRSIQAQKMEAVGQLAGGVAHDFNNILTAVTGNLELYQVVDDPDEREQFVRDAHNAAERAATLVRQLLAYSRKSTLTVAEHSVQLIFDQVTTLSRRLLPSSINLVFTEPCDRMRVRVDQNQLITAMINLIVNARDALGGSGLLEVRATPCELPEPTPMLDGATIAPGRYVCITIQDNGPGIPRDVLRRVTEPFFTTKAIGEGSGLGLSMVEGFARQSGGGMMIETSPAGTRVRLYLPCATRREDMVPARQSDTIMPALGQPAIG